MEVWIPIFTVVLCMLVGYNEACSCMQTHPQAAYCEADYAVRANIRSEEIINMYYEVERNGTMVNVSQPIDRKYTIKIRRVLKSTDKFVNSTKTFVFTSYMENLCGVELQVGKQYLLMGRIVGDIMIINLCNSPKKWSQLTDQQRRGVSYMYKKHCSCQVIPCYGESCDQAWGADRDSCILDWGDDWMSGCMVEHGQCKRTGDGGFCRWSPRRKTVERKCLQSRLP